MGGIVNGWNWMDGWYCWWVVLVGGTVGGWVDGNVDGWYCLWMVLVVGGTVDGGYC